MEEEAIFKASGNVSSGEDQHHPENPINYAPEGSPVQVQTQEVPQASASPVVSQNVYVEPLSQTSSSQERDSFFSGFSGSKLIKMLLGLGVLILIVVIIFGFILPLFGKSIKNGKVTLTYWGLWEDQRVMAPVISTFERENPNIKIDYVRQDSKDYRERLTTRIDNGNGPDIFRFHNTWYPMLRQYLLPLPSSVVDGNTFKKNYYQVASDDLIKNGAIYGIPLEIDTLALYLNNDLFSAAGVQPPTTWQDLRADARALTVTDESGRIQTAGVAAGTFANVDHAPDIISLLFAQNGVNLQDISKTDQRVVDALSFYTSFAQGTDKVWDETLDPSITAFSKGNLAMFFGYSWDFFTIKALNPNLSFKIVPVPQLSKGNPLNMTSYWAEGVSVKSTHQKEALLFMKYLSSVDAQEQIYSEESKTRLFGEPYAYRDLSQKLAGDPNVSPFLDEAPTAVSSYFVDSTFDNGLNAQLNKYLENAVNGISDTTSAQSAAQTLEQGFSQVLNQYGTP